ncbi:MAG: hypothetical protein AB1847_08750 [bacterium]
MSLKVYDLKTHATVWYFDCAAQGAGREAKDWIFGSYGVAAFSIWKRKGKEPPPPYVLLASLAEEVVRIMAGKGENR